MPKFGRLEAKVTVPTGGWTFTMSITGLGGSSVRTIAAGSYWPDELLTQVEAQLEAGEIALGGADGFTVTGGFGEGGTMKVLLEHDSATHFAISAWTTALQNYLGFAATLSGANEYTGTERCEAVWQADCPYDANRGQTLGVLQRDRSVSVSSDGTMSGHGFVSRRKMGRVMWRMVGVKRSLTQYETVVNESFETWFGNTHQGLVTYFGAAPLVRFYWDADASTKVTIRLTEPLQAFDPERVDAMWIGLWPVVIDGWVQT